MELHNAVQSCKEVADELLQILEDLKVALPRQKWKSFRQALKGIMKKEKIQSLNTRLQRLQQQVQFRLINILKQANFLNVSFLLMLLCSMYQSQTLSAVDGLVLDSKRLESKMTDQLEGLKSEINNAIKPITRAQAVTTDALKEITPKLMEALLSFDTERKRVANSLAYLNSLYFGSMDVRLSDVKEQHAKTFQWIFRGNRDGESQHSTFLQWLKLDDGIYWITGKAGSGKSTLMKYLWYHPGTRDALKTWTGGRRLVTASHFFWNAGNNTLRMSQTGLLRSLLYQVLRQCPELIMYVCTLPSDTDDNSLQDWSLPILLKAFERLAKQTHMPIKICLFVNGLDEYSGNHPKICRFFRSCASSDTLKCCVSSRPWNAFENAFGVNQKRKLMLQDLTRKDIQIYVCDKLGEDHRFHTLALTDRRYQGLINQIVDKAEGVFLWVYLVVQSLLDGLEDDNDIPDLQRRVDLLPSDLEKFFRHMLREIEVVYRSQTAELFQVCLHAKSQLPVSTIDFLRQERDDANHAIVALAASLSKNKILSAIQKSNKYINGRIRGLLEINKAGESEFFLLV